MKILHTENFPSISKNIHSIISSQGKKYCDKSKTRTFMPRVDHISTTEKISKQVHKKLPNHIPSLFLSCPSNAHCLKKRVPVLIHSNHKATTVQENHGPNWIFIKKKLTFC